MYIPHLYRYMFSSRHVQNIYCAKNIHTKHTHPHSIFQDEFLMALGQDDWQTKYNFFLYILGKNIFTLIIHSCFIRQSWIKCNRTHRRTKKNPFVLSIILYIELDETKTKFLRIFRFTRFIILLKYFQFITERSSFSYCMEQSKSIKLYVQQYWLGLLLSETRPLMNIDNGEGGLLKCNVVWDGAHWLKIVMEYGRVNVFAGWFSWGYEFWSKSFTWEWSKTMTEQNIFA